MKLEFNKDMNNRISFKFLDNGYYLVETLGTKEKSVMIIHDKLNLIVFIDNESKQITYLKREDYVWIENNLRLIEVIDKIDF